MKLMLDAFWRAVAYCVHPRVIGLSLLPLLLMTVFSLVLGYFFWQPMVEATQTWLATLGFFQVVSGWLTDVGLAVLLGVVPAALVLMLVTPLILVLSLLVVATFMTSAMAELVGQRRFPHLERKRGANLASAVWWSLASTAMALLVMLLSMPFWLIPPLVLILPPLIWGWLTYRVFAFDSLAVHASKQERLQILREHRGNLLIMGVLTGYLGAAPSMLLASGAFFLAPLLVPVAIWIYTVVFALASLWFSHYALTVLSTMREQATPAAGPPAPHVDTAPVASLPAPPSGPSIP